MSTERTLTTGHTESTPVNHPKHYNLHPSGVECIDLIEWLPGNLFNAAKYLWRKDEKHDDAVEDTNKALWYLRRELGRMRSGHLDPKGADALDKMPSDVLDQYRRWLWAEPDATRREIVQAIFDGSYDDLSYAESLASGLLAGEQ